MLYSKWQPFCLSLNVLSIWFRSWPVTYQVTSPSSAHDDQWQLRPVFLKPGPLFTKNTSSLWFRDPHYKPETVIRPSQVYNGISYTCNCAFSVNSGPGNIHVFLTSYSHHQKKFWPLRGHDTQPSAAIYGHPKSWPITPKASA